MRNSVDKRLIITIVIIVIALIGVFAAAVYCTVDMRYAINNQIYSNLKDVAEQTDSAIEMRVNLYVDLMNNLRDELEELEEEKGSKAGEAEIEQFQTYADLNGLLRVAFCDVTGKSYGSDGASSGVDLSDREFFTRGMEGNFTITPRMKDRMNPAGNDINIIAGPWYVTEESEKYLTKDVDYKEITVVEDGKEVTKKIRGVFGITFYSERIVDLLHIEAFGGDGGSFATNENGIIMIDSRNAKEGETLTDYLSEEHTLSDVLKDSVNGGKNDDIVDKVVEELQSGTFSYGSSYIDGEEVLYYQIPISFSSLEGDVEWNIFTIVSMDYVDERFNVINMDFYLLVGVFLTIFIISLIAVLVLASRHRATIEKIAYVDSVTGGDNYAMFIRRLRDLKVKCGTFISMDMVEFNSVRVAVGAAGGDKILAAVNKRLTEFLGENEFVAHAGRDNFALFLSITDEELVKHRIREFSTSLLDLSQELSVPHLRIRCGVYISRYFTSENIDDCCNCAGQAREVARKQNRMYWLYSEEDNSKMLMECELAGFFPQAIENNEFEVWYQPKYDTMTGKIVGAEALVRWRKDGKLISPGKFIPLFESNGMIAKLDEYMFRNVCRRQKLRQANGKRVVPVSVNLSRATMYNENITEKYMGILNIYGVDVRHVQIEITESAVIGKDDLTALLQKFRGMGEHILLDDFGTGYSSISMLGLKCFDTLKVDKSLVDNIGSEDGETLVSSIIHMAHKLEMSVTAEGVESKEQYEQLRELECDAIQGFYFSKPLPTAEFEALLDAGK